MKPVTYLCALSALGLLGLGTAHAETAEQKLKTLPAAVQKTIASESPHGGVVSVEPKTMEGAMRYKVGVDDHGKHLTLVIEAAGKLLVTKTDVAANDLPAPVRKTLEPQIKGAKVERNSLVSKAGKTYYEVELQTSGHKKELVIETGGELTRVEEVVPLETVPAVVKSAIDKVASRGKFMKVKTIILKGKLIAYEAAVDINGVKTEFKLTPEGQPLG